MKILKLLMLLLVLSSLSCRIQNQQKNSHGRIFDIQKFEKKKDEKGEHYFVDNDSIVIQKREGKYYQEKSFLKGKKNYYSVRSYNEEGILKAEGKSFLGIKIGKTYGYDEQGNLTRVDDYTRPNFTFKAEQLAEKMKREFSIDLYNGDGWYIKAEEWGSNEDGIHYEWWVVGYELVDRVRVRKTYRIDAKTGNLINIEEGDYGVGGT